MEFCFVGILLGLGRAVEWVENWRHPERSRGSQALRLKAAPRDSSTALGMTEACRDFAHTAFSPISSVRMRTACSTGNTNTLPSPILPVFAALTTTLTALSTMSSASTTLNLHLRQKIDRVFAPAINFRVPFLAAEALHFRHRHSLDSELGERFLHFFEFERLDDRFEFFMGVKVVALGRFSIGLVVENQRSTVQRKRRFLVDSNVAARLPVPILGNGPNRGQFLPSSPNWSALSPQIYVRLCTSLAMGRR